MSPNTCFIRPRADSILGLASNVGLTISKGLAGLWMNSASLLAEAGHSLSDLLGVSPPNPRAFGLERLTRIGLCDVGDMADIT